MLGPYLVNKMTLLQLESGRVLTTCGYDSVMNYPSLN